LVLDLIVVKIKVTKKIHKQPTFILMCLKDLASLANYFYKFSTLKMSFTKNHHVLNTVVALEARITKALKCPMKSRLKTGDATSTTFDFYTVIG